MDPPVHGSGAHDPGRTNPYDDRVQSPQPPRQRSRSTIESALAQFKIDFEPQYDQPRTARLVLATVLSVVGSLVADAILVAIGTAIFPSTKDYSHFQFSDYSKLTIIGVVIACAAWPVVTRVSSAPRWVFVRMAIAVTAVLLLPDLYLLANGEPAKAVVVLMAMHLVIGLVTYSALVRIAPARMRRIAV